MTGKERHAPGAASGWRERIARVFGLGWVRIAIAVFWVVVVAATAPLASRIGEVEENDNASFLPASSESLEASRRLDTFPTGETTTAVLVYARDGGLNDADRAAIERDRESLASAHADWSLSPPIPAEDGSAVIFTVALPDTSEEQVADAVEAMRETVAASATGGLEVKVTGPAGIGYDLGQVFEGINSRLLLSAAVVVAVLLLVTYRSPVLWILPLLVVGFADRIATGVLYALGRWFDVPVNGQSTGIMAILVFGAGTDYALLLIARYREELRRHESPIQAMRVALAEAMPSILASAGTVILGLACLLVADLNSNRSLGPAGVAGIVCALVVTLTLLPVLLILGRRGVFWPFVPRYDPAHTEDTGIWARLGRAIERRPRRIWVAVTVVLAVCALGLANYRISFDLADQFTDTPEAIAGVELIAERFPAGASQPATVVGNRAAAADIQAALEGVEGVASVQPAGETEALAAFSVVLASAPGSEAAFATVQDLRDALDALPAADAVVGGPDAESYDVERANARDQTVIIPLVLAVVFLVLCLLLRSIVAPVLLIVTSVVSTVSALGVAVFVFTDLLGYNGLQPGILLIGFVFLIALGVDYNIFLMGRAHEEAPRLGTREGMHRSLTATGNVITSAGIVLAATFAILGFLPLVALAQVGFLVAFGVLLDTLLVRSVLVPAVTFDVGRRIWWPSALARRDET